MTCSDSSRSPECCRHFPGDSGFIVFTVDDNTELIRVYDLVWVG
jgi:hypothetical protein